MPRQRAFFFEKDSNRSCSLFITKNLRIETKLVLYGSGSREVIKSLGISSLTAALDSGEWQDEVMGPFVIKAIKNINIDIKGEISCHSHLDYQEIQQRNWRRKEVSRDVSQSERKNKFDESIQTSSFSTGFLHSPSEISENEEGHIYVVLTGKNNAESDRLEKEIPLILKGNKPHHISSCRYHVGGSSRFSLSVNEVRLFVENEFNPTKISKGIINKLNKSADALVKETREGLVEERKAEMLDDIEKEVTNEITRQSERYFSHGNLPCAIL